LLRVNDVILLSDENTIERILWISPDYANIFTIDLKSSKLKINYRKVNKIERKIHDGEADFDNENYKSRIISFDDMNERELKLLEDAWRIIKLIALEDNEPDIYVEKHRNNLIKNAVKELNICKSTVYKYLKKYWIGGKSKTALISAQRNCGGKGKSRSSFKKLGRPRESTNDQGRNITERDKKNFEIALKKYRKFGIKISLRKVYDLMIADYYSEYEIIDDEVIINNGNRAKPSYEQFRNYYYSPNQKIKRIIINEKGEKDYLLNHDSKLSNSKYTTFGPGYRYEIDSTIPPVYLVNRIIPERKLSRKSKNVGRPTMTLVADVFSTLITGVYIDLNNASWEHSVSALYSK
jgi:transposase